LPNLCERGWVNPAERYRDIRASRINGINNTITQKWVPLPNSTGTFNWISNDPQKLSTEQYNWRIDHRI